MTQGDKPRVTLWIGSTGSRTESEEEVASWLQEKIRSGFVKGS